ncbi:Mur ligase [Melampsora americana]|nr:Mur ligase [Melampsora americana]
MRASGMRFQVSNISRLQFKPQVTRRSLSIRYFTAASTMYAENVHRGYKEAVTALNTLQSNADVLAAIQAAGPQPPAQVLHHTTYYLRRLGYQLDTLNVLNVVHISGTKGKGSTAAFCSSLLTNLNNNAKVGLFTSPHLVAVRERIRINGKPISEELFAKYFWEVWDRFEDGHGEPILPEISIRPAYFRYLTFMAYHTFLSERVDATVLEVGVGGLLDPTNLVPSPIVTGVTSLGLDHVHILGHSILEIAGHKAGIFKPGVPAMSVKQEKSGALEVLRARAIEVQASSFSVVPEHPALEEARIGLAGNHQKYNAALAIALINTFLASPRLPPCFSSQIVSPRDDTASSLPSPNLPPLFKPTSFISDTSSLPAIPSLPSGLITPQPLPDQYLQALKATKWPGRCQVIQDPLKPSITWSLDGAHTEESVACCGKWWKHSITSARSTSPSAKKALIFNCTSGRSGELLLKTFLDCLKEDPVQSFSFDKVIISTNTTYSNGHSKVDLTCVASYPDEPRKLKVQEEIASAWKSLRGRADTVMITQSIEDAVVEIRTIDEPVDVLVTGSLHLVGGVLEVAKLLDESS